MTTGRVPVVLRRPAAVLFAAIALVACGSTGSDDVVARVGDAVLTRDDLIVIARSPLAGDTADDATLDGDLARRIITVWVRNTAVVGSGVLDGVDADEIRQRLAAEEIFLASPPAAQQLLIDNARMTTAVDEGTVSEDDVQRIVASAAIDITSRFGAWDTESFSVLAIGAAGG